MPVSLQPAILKYKNSNGVYQTADCLKGDVDLGVIGASVGQVAKITAVDANGVPTAWAPVDSYPKKVFEYTFSDNWYKCSVSSIDYSTGVITLAANDAPFTNSYDTTLMVWAVPLIDGIVGSYYWGYMPPELYGINHSSNKRGVLVGTNQIKIYTNSSTSIDTLTQPTNVNLSRFQIWATDKKTNFNRIDVTDFEANHRYRIILSANNGGPCAAEWFIENNIVQTASSNTGYATHAPSVSTTNTELIYVNSMNGYEALSFRGIKHYGTDDKMFDPFPKFIICDMFRVNSGTWVMDGTSYCANWGNKVISNITEDTKMQIVSGKVTGYFTNSIKTLRIAFAGTSGTSFAPLDGGKVLIYDLGEQY